MPDWHQAPAAYLSAARWRELPGGDRAYVGLNPTTGLHRAEIRRSYNLANSSARVWCLERHSPDSATEAAPLAWLSSHAPAAARIGETEGPDDPAPRQASLL